MVTMPATSARAVARRKVRASRVSPSAPSAGSGRKGFGAASRDNGHSRAPAPPERMIGTNAIGGVRLLGDRAATTGGLYPSRMVALTASRGLDTVAAVCYRLIRPVPALWRAAVATMSKSTVSGEATVPDPSSGASKLVRHFRQILIWPLQIQPIRSDAQIQEPWEILQQAGPDNPWSELRDEFDCDPAQFQQRHYSEFVTFLPYVRSFLYGEGKAGSAMAAMESPIRVFRRTDVAKVRMTFPGAGAETITFDVAHIDLCLFYDIDVAILVVEIFGRDLSLARAQEPMYRFGRAYPTYWPIDNFGGHCLAHAAWLAKDGSVLAVSDYEQR